MNNLLDTAPCGFLSFTDDGTITLANATLAAMVGAERDALVGRHVEKILTVGARIFYQTHFFPLLRLHGKAEEVYLALRAPGEGEVPVLVSAVRRERDGRPANDCAIFPVRQRGEYEDELLKAKRAAEEAARARDEFLAAVAHELRTPLGAIVGWVNVLRMAKGDPKATERGVETIERNAKAQSRLIEDLLDVSRVVAGKLRMEVGPVDLAAVARAALDVVRPAAEAKGVRLEADLDSGAGPVSGDPDRLQQVLWNLLSNAVKFTPKGGSVRVCLRRVESYVEIRVADTGQGISPEFLPYVFDRFRQAEGASGRRQGGLGLGMAISREIVALHGGAIRAESEGEGKGAMFVVTLPIPPLHTPMGPKVPAAAAAGRPGPVTDLAGVDVLVVDDVAEARDALTAALVRVGARVTAAASAGEAFDRVRELRPAVLVSDVEMPGEDGLSLLRRVRALPPEGGGRTPAVALTGSGRFTDRMQALAAGFQVSLAKPADPDELVAVIANLCS